MTQKFIMCLGFTFSKGEAHHRWLPTAIFGPFSSNEEIEKYISETANKGEESSDRTKLSEGPVLVIDGELLDIEKYFKGTPR